MARSTVPIEIPRARAMSLMPTDLPSLELRSMARASSAVCDRGSGTPLGPLAIKIQFQPRFAGTFTEPSILASDSPQNSLDHQRIYGFRVKMHCDQLLISTTLDLDSFHVLLPVRHTGAWGRGGRDQLNGIADNRKA